MSSFGWQQQKYRNNLKMQNNSPWARWQVTPLYHKSLVIDMPSKGSDKGRLCLTNARRLHSCCILTSLPAVTAREELHRAEEGSTRWLHRFLGFPHISLSSLPLSLYTMFTFSLSAFIPCLFVLSLSQPILTGFTGRGLRPAVAIRFEFFQVFLQQEGGLVLLLERCVFVCAKKK